MLTEIQKSIYNTHLATSRQNQNKPFTIRKDFENFETQKPEEYSYLLKIEQLIKSCNLNLKVYFKSPYTIYKDTPYFDLQFYTTQKAIKCYTIYIRLMQNKLPDDKDQLEFIKDSLVFIKDFCIEKNIFLRDYFNFKIGETPAWALHLITYKISIYLLIGLELLNFNIRQFFSELCPDDREMYLGDIDKLYPKYKQNILNSKMAKPLILKGINKIEGLIAHHNLPF
jgi:hypothetical protein